MPGPESDLLAPIFAKLAVVAPSKFGEQHVSENDSPGRYVWAPDSGEFGAAENVGDEPRSLYDCQLAFVVHCWGDTFDEMWDLIRALVTALREVTLGANFVPVNTTFLRTSWATRGWIANVQVALRVPVLEHPLDGPEYVKAQADTAVIDDSNGVVGDGTLTAPHK